MAPRPEDIPPDTEELLAAYRARRKAREDRPEDEAGTPERAGRPEDDEVGTPEREGRPEDDRTGTSDREAAEGPEGMPEREADHHVGPEEEATAASGAEPTPDPEVPEETDEGAPDRGPAPGAPWVTGPRAPPPPETWRTGTAPPAPSEAEVAAEEDRRLRQALEPRRGPEVAMGPGAEHLGLRERLLSHRFMTVRHLPAVRTAGFLLTAVVALAYAWELRDGGVTRTLGLRGHPVQEALLALLGLGLLLALAGLLSRRRPRLRMHLPRRQADLWDRVQDQVRSYRVLLVGGQVSLLLGLLLVPAAYLLPEHTRTLLAAGAVLLAAGLLFLFAAASRWGPLRQLYVQTLLLAWLESSRVLEPSVDEVRVRRVLVALDRLLGALPDEELERFLASEDAQEYLALMHELRGGPDGAD